MFVLSDKKEKKERKRKEKMCQTFVLILNKMFQMEYSDNLMQEAFNEARGALDKVPFI